MTYNTVQPPFTRKFREMSKTELADYGECNPIQLMTVLADALVDKTKTARRLRELYDIWSAKTI
jgi:hypothetical protein